MSAVSKTEQVLRECEKFGLDIVAISEARWKGCGEKKSIATVQKQQRKPVNERILYARFVSNHAKLSLIVCYVPTDDADNTLKGEFYDILQSVIDSIPHHDVTCIAGDLNAKVGQDRFYCPKVMGHHGFGTINENRPRFVSFTMGNDLLICGTLFKHKYIHKYTWISPDSTAKNKSKFPHPLEMANKPKRRSQVSEAPTLVQTTRY
ncbi:hypothetical protein QYM36_005368 [Artemia franciscana]|uniref:Craniofacial development protein 2-like n=1 Tax=Artemia franciscana TaxID=6661 RepID=A0AA88IFB7_ARTSF|nr:hypothetical protein QYM36_005368 [Artemia franciscana]